MVKNTSQTSNILVKIKANQNNENVAATAQPWPMSTQGDLQLLTQQHNCKPCMSCFYQVFVQLCISDISHSNSHTRPL